MLRKLKSSDSRFHEVQFGPGLNLLVAERDEASTDTDSRNGAGKSSMIELLHFLLGARNEASAVWANDAIKNHTFELLLDWPGQPEAISVKRSGASPGRIIVYPDITNSMPAALFAQKTDVPLKTWQWAIERDLYKVTTEDSGVSGRAMLAFAMRRVGRGGFLEPTKTVAQQSPHDAMINLCYLFGLDVALTTQYRNLSNQETTRRKLVEAAKDPVWGRIVGKSAELRGEMGAVEQRISELERQIAAFRVVPEYEHIRRNADLLGERIRAMRAADDLDRRNLQDMQQAATDISEPDDRYLETAYQQLGVVIGSEVRRRFDEVRVFHQAVVRNRERQLRDEIDRVSRALEERRREREALGEQQAALLRTLNSGGALDALTALQYALAREQAQLESLRHRFQAAQALEASRREIEIKRLELEEAIVTDLEDRAEITDAANKLFNQYARKLYGDDSNPYLAFKPGRRRMEIEAHIADDRSRGIHNMLIFCFDLTLAVTAHRAGRGPDFLVHDSHLYDGVDERQVALALELAADVMSTEGLQYIVTMNTDDLNKAVSMGFNADPYIIEPYLTDQSSGGLFGFRF
ncbi:ABC-three component system protein [Nonomuraea sp. NPDC049714]|uniref:ABC-three component system protein n=1 Tax=Nonomuraea sp. NPDC049714 TaxID=3364357 RepID=UPI0037A0FB60